MSLIQPPVTRVIRNHECGEKQADLRRKERAQAKIALFSANSKGQQLLKEAVTARPAQYLQKLLYEERNRYKQVRFT